MLRGFELLALDLFRSASSSISTLIYSFSLRVTLQGPKLYVFETFIFIIIFICNGL